ncbi:MAG: pro-sigmaK processing inhibitor BofA family protein [Clostridiaceae bacterium]|nr:pro-sigmaK processing inhibitor BofA family protein [Clostridiaceae bacterium]
MILCVGAALALWAVIRLFSAPIKLGLKLIINTLLGFAFLLVFNLVAVHMGISLGINAINAFILALFGPAGLVMLLFLRWTAL